MTAKLTQMRLWMRAATADEQRELAHKAGTSRQYLYHLAADDESRYKREPKPELAAAIERETAAMHKSSGGRLPVIYRTDLVTGCRNCEFAQRCLGAVAQRADFPIVTTEDAS